MANTSYQNGKLFVPVDCGKVVFEDISLNGEIVDLEKVSVDFAKEQVIVDKVEPLAILDTKLDDYSNVDLNNEQVNIHHFIGATNKETTFSQRLLNLLNTDITTPIRDALNTEVSISFHGFGNKDKTAPLQEVFDNFINMVVTEEDGC